MKYIIPRNPEIPDPDFRDVLASGVAMKNEKGEPAGQGSFIYHGRDPRLPKKDMVTGGKMFVFESGMIYVPGKEYSLLDHAREPFSAAMPLISGGLSELFEHLPQPFDLMADEAVEHLFSESMQPDSRPPGFFDVFFGKPTPQMSITDYARSPALAPGRKTADPAAHVITPPRNLSGAESPRLAEITGGALLLPGVQLIEIDDSMVPGGFIVQDDHRLHLTFERLDGRQTVYTLQSFGKGARERLDAFTTVLVTERWRSELDHLIYLVKAEHVSLEPMLAACIAKYPRGSSEPLKDTGKIIAEFNTMVNDELRQKGLNAGHVSAAVLSRLSNLLPYYRQIPKLNDEVQKLEDAARGQ
jgi:hypothetical protein